MTELDAAARLQARARVYGLLARLLVRGLDARALETLRALDWLVPEHADLDELAAEHVRWFQLELFPYAGVYLDASARAGAWADRVRSHYARAGFHPRLDEVAADHLGIELAFASFVSAAAGEALEDGHPELARRLELQLAAFFDDALLRWLPALCVASEALGPGYWSAVLGAALELVAEHRAGLPSPRTELPALELGPREDILAEARTGLRQIAEQLLVPALSGLCLTRSDLARLGRSRALPKGFGSRVIMLDNLLRSAVDYGELEQLLAGLHELIAERDARYAALGEALAIQGAVEPWRTALAHTRALVDTLAAAASEAPSPTIVPLVGWAR